MPTLTFKWKFYGPTDDTPYFLDDGEDTEATWISRVDWRTQTQKNDLIPTNISGLYIIEDAQNSPIYAGKSKNIRERFDKRSKVLTEFKLTTASTLTNYSIWATSVVSKPQNYADKIWFAERWVVRFLTLLDKRNNSPRQLQNVLLTSSFKAPDGGLTITFDKRQSPPYFVDKKMEGYVSDQNNIVTYKYKANYFVLGA